MIIGLLLSNFSALLIGRAHIALVPFIQIGQDQKLGNYKTKKQLKAQGRSSSEEREGTAGGVSIRILKWFDNWAVTLASTFTSDSALSTVSQWDKSIEKTY